MLNLKHKLLTAEEEFALGERIQRGDQTAVDKLVTNNLALATSFAKELALKGDDLDDVCSLAFEGLIEAAKRFDPSKKVRFSTYAYHWVKASINRNRLSSSCISAPSMIRWTNSALRKIAYEHQEGRIEDEKLFDAFRKKYPHARRSANKTLAGAMGALRHGISLQAPIENKNRSESDRTLADIVADDQESAQDAIERQHSIERVREIIDRLIPVYRYVTRMLMADVLLKDIAYQLGFTSRERARQIGVSAREVIAKSYESGRNPGSMMIHGFEIAPSSYALWWELGHKMRCRINKGARTWEKLKESDHMSVQHRHTLAWLLDKEMVKRGKNGLYEVIPVHAVAEVSP